VISTLVEWRIVDRSVPFFLTGKAIQMSTYVMTDIHGKKALFLKALQVIDLQPSDELIILGDVIDRGEDSKGVLDALIHLKAQGRQITCLFGNHEQMLLDAFLSEQHLKLWLHNGGHATLNSFQAASIGEIPPMYLNFVKGFRYYLERDQHLFVHAALNMKIEDPFQDLQTIIWERKPENLLDREWLGNRKLVHGHTPVARSTIKASHQSDALLFNMDNGVYLKKEDYGALCILELENNRLSFIS
jgi:serine/threonine protein phosphatase 1